MAPLNASTTSDTPGYPALLGREREQDVLRQQLERMLAGQGSTILISGEAGIGKTSLADDLAAFAAAADALVLWGHAYDLTVTPPYGPWIELARRYVPTSDLPPFPAFLHDRDALAAVGSQDALFAQTWDFFTTLAASRPVVLILDDFHWADQESLSLLRFVAREVAHHRILVLVTYRSDELTRRHPLYQLVPLLVREAQATRLELHRLDDAAIHDLITQRYRLAEADLARLETYLGEHADGNPLYAGELLRTLEDDRVLSQQAEDWTLGDLSRVRLPPLLMQVIEGRLERLSEATRRLLEIAAVIGQEGPLDLWQRVSEADEEALSTAIVEGIEAHLLLEAPGGQVRFSHALVREALYQGIVLVRRRVWHRTVGAALAEIHSPDPDAVAYHFTRAGDAREGEWLVRAGERAQLAYAWATAVERYEAALHSLEHDGTDILRQGWLSYRIARLRRYGTPEQSIAYLDRALQIAEAAQDAALLAAAGYTRGLCRFFAGDLAVAVGEMTVGVDALEALPLAEQKRLDLDPDTSGELVITNPRGMLITVLATAGYLQEARTMGEATREGSPRRTPLGEMAWAHYGDRFVGLGQAYAWTGQPEAARIAFARARSMFQQIGNYSTLGTASVLELLTVSLPYETDRLDKHQQQAQRAAEAWAQAFPVEDQPAAAVNLPILRLAGQWGLTRTIAEGAWRSGRGRSQASQTSGVILAELAARQGEPELSWAIVSTLLPDGPSMLPGTTSLGVTLPLQRLAAAMALDDGDLAMARAWLEAHDRWLEWSGAVLGRAEGTLLWAQYHRADGNLSRARTSAEQALAHASEPRQPLALIAVHRFLGVLDTQAKRFDAADDHLRQSLTLADACAAPFERALTLLAFAELRVAQRQPEEARALLSEVRAICEPLAAKPTLARVDALMKLLVASPAKAARTAFPAGLTAREVEVLRLLAQGLSTPDIAGQLFLSRRTVDTHLSAIYRKLDVTSRTAAARFAVEHDLT